MFFGFRVGELRNAKIQDLSVPVGGQKNVSRLYIAMNDAVLMRCLQPFENLYGERKHLLYLLRSHGGTLGIDELLNRLTFEQWHHDEWLSLVLAEFVNGADVGMFQR